MLWVWLVGRGDELTAEPAATQVWRPGSRVARLRASHSYGAVLVLIAGSFIFIAAAPDSDWAVSVLVLLQCATLLLALFTSGLGQDRRPAIPLAAIAGVAAVSVTSSKVIRRRPRFSVWMRSSSQRQSPWLRSESSIKAR